MKRSFKLKYETILYILITLLTTTLSENTKIIITETFQNNSANYFFFQNNDGTIYIAKQAIQSENRQIFSFNPNNNLVENLPSETDPPYLLEKFLWKSKNNEHILIYQTNVQGFIKIKGNNFDIITSLENTMGMNIYDMKFVEINNESGLIVINDISNPNTVLCYISSLSKTNNLFTSPSNFQCEIAFDNIIICFLTENNRLKYFFITNSNDVISNSFMDTEIDIIDKSLLFYTDKTTDNMNHIICYTEQNSFFGCYTISIDIEQFKVDWENKSKIYSNTLIQPTYSLKSISLLDSVAFISYLYNNVGFNIVLLNDVSQQNSELKYHLFSIDDTYTYLDHIVVDGILFILYHDQSVVYIQSFYSFENIYQKGETNTQSIPTFYVPNYISNEQSVNLISLPVEIQDQFTIDGFNIPTVGNYSVLYYYESNDYHYYFKNILNIIPRNCLTTDSTGLMCEICKENYILSEDGNCIDPNDVPDGYYYEPEKGMFYKCAEHCRRCELDSLGMNICTSCNETFILYNNYCVSNCPANVYYSYDLKSCFDNCPDDYITVIYTNNTIVCYSYIEEISNDLPKSEELIEKFELNTTDEQQQIILSTVQNIINNTNNLTNFTSEIYIFQEYFEKIKTISNHNEFIIEEKFVNDIQTIVEKLMSNFNTTLNDFYNYQTTNLLLFKEFNTFITNTNLILTNNSFIKMQSFFRDLLTLLQTKNIPNNSFISAASQSLNSFIQLSIDNNQIHHETNTTFNITLFNESETYQYENSLIINKNTTSISNFLNEQLVLVSKQMEEQSLFFQSPLYSFGTFKLNSNNNKQIKQNNYNIITHKEASLSVVIYNDVSSVNSNTLYNIIIDNKISTLIAIPSSLSNIDNMSYIGIVKYTNSPYINPLLSNKNKLSNNVLSILMFDTNNKEIQIDYSDKIFYIVLPKSHYNVNRCSFINKTTGKLDNKGCVSEELVKYVICKCSHLTDFTLASFDISKLIGDNESIFVDKRFIDSFEIFIHLNKSNAYMFYFYIVFLSFYFGSLIYISCHNKENETSNFFLPENNYTSKHDKVNAYRKYINNKVNEKYNELQLNEISNQQNKNKTNDNEHYVELEQIINSVDDDNEDDLLSEQSSSLSQNSNYLSLITFKIIFSSIFLNEYRPIAIFSKKQLPTISKHNLTILTFTRIIIQICIASFISKIHLSPPYNRFSIETIKNVSIIIFLSDILYSIFEYFLSKKQVDKTYSIVEIEFSKLKIVWRFIVTYLIIVFMTLLNILNTIWLYVYTNIYNVKIDFMIDFSICFIVDYVLYEILIILLKSLMFTKAVRGNKNGCICKIINKILFGLEYVFYKYDID